MIEFLLIVLILLIMLAVFPEFVYWVVVIGFWFAMAAVLIVLVALG